MKKISFLLIACLCLFASCDKVETFTVFSGSTGTWYDGAGVADHSQRAFLEKYTGPRCPNCPTADEVISTALGKYGEQLIAIAVHDSSYFGKPLGDVDLRTDDGNTWSQFLGVFSAGSYPTARLNRTVSGSSFEVINPVSGFDSKIDAILASEPLLALEVGSTLDGRDAAIDVNLEFLNTIAEPTTLTLIIIEDSIVAPQTLPDGSHDEAYVHNHILRDVITDVWGADVDADGQAGTKRYVRFDYQVPETYRLEHCHIVAFVSYKGSRQIINAAECDL